MNFDLPRPRVAERHRMRLALLSSCSFRCSIDFNPACRLPSGRINEIGVRRKAVRSPFASVGRRIELLEWFEKKADSDSHAHSEHEAGNVVSRDAHRIAPQLTVVLSTPASPRSK
jgi:hypothetical protein